MRGKDKDASAPAAICRKVLRGSFMTLPDELEGLRKADGSANQISTDCSPAEDRIAAFDFAERSACSAGSAATTIHSSLFPQEGSKSAFGTQRPCRQSPDMPSG